VISFLYIFAKTVQIIISVVSFSMFIRAIMPIFFEVEGNRFYALTCVISEPFIAPVRYVMVKLNIGQNSPIDWSFFVTYLILWLLESLLPVI